MSGFATYLGTCNTLLMLRFATSLETCNTLLTLRFATLLWRVFFLRGVGGLIRSCCLRDVGLCNFSWNLQHVLDATLCNFSWNLQHALDATLCNSSLKGFFFWGGGGANKVMLPAWCRALQLLLELATRSWRYALQLLLEFATRSWCYALQLLSGILTDISLSDIYSGILSEIYSVMVSGILLGIYSGIILAVYLTFVAFYRKCGCHHNETHMLAHRTM